MILISESKLKELQSENATLRAKLATYEQVELPEGHTVERDEHGISVHGPTEASETAIAFFVEDWRCYQYLANALRKLQEEA